MQDDEAKMDPSAPAVRREGERERRFRVVLADPIHPIGIERLRQRFDLVPLAELQDEDAKREAIASADALIVRVFAVTAELLDRAPRLRLVAKHGSGVDNIDIEAASRRGVLVANTPGGANASSVAEGAVMLMLAILRRTVQMDSCVREGRFQDRWKLVLRDLSGKTLGIVGLGQIGKCVARICGAGFDMRVVAYDPYAAAAEAAAIGVERLPTLPALMALADVISIHTPLTASTRHLIGGPELAAMKPTAIIVNTSRGPVIDERALVVALKEGRIAGAGLDVFEDEPPTMTNPLLGLGNVVLSPHVAGVTEDSLKGMALAVAGVVEEVLDDKRPATLLNPTVWESPCR